MKTKAELLHSRGITVREGLGGSKIITGRARLGAVQQGFLLDRIRADIEAAAKIYDPETPLFMRGMFFDENLAGLGIAFRALDALEGPLWVLEHHARGADGKFVKVAVAFLSSHPSSRISYGILGRGKDTYLGSFCPSPNGMRLTGGAYFTPEDGIGWRSVLTS